MKYVEVCVVCEVDDSFEIIKKADVLEILEPENIVEIRVESFVLSD